MKRSELFAVVAALEEQIIDTLLRRFNADPARGSSHGAAVMISAFNRPQSDCLRVATLLYKVLAEHMPEPIPYEALAKPEETNRGGGWLPFAALSEDPPSVTIEMRWADVLPAAAGEDPQKG